MSFTGLDHSQLSSNLDGKDQWKAISQSRSSPRTEILHNIDDILNYGAIRQGDWKYVYGSASKGKMDRWYGNNGEDSLYHYDENAVVSSQAGTALSGLITYQQIKEKNDNIAHHRNANFAVSMLDVTDIKRLREEATVLCKMPKAEEQLEGNQCNPMVSPCLFNIKEDPCEMVNLASQRPLIVVTLEQELINYRKTARSPINVPRDPNADPAKYNGTWTNWQDAEVRTEKIAFNTLSQLTIGLISGACVAVVIIILILLTLTCRKSTKGTNTPFYEQAEKCIEMDSKSDHLFEEREKQLRTCLKDEFRDV